MPQAPDKLILPKPRPEAAPEVVKKPFATRHRTMLRAIRVVLGLVVLALFAYAFINYDIYTVPGNPGGAKIMGIRRGDSVVITRYKFWRGPHVGDLVFYQVPGEAGNATQIGRVMGLPGEKVERRGPTMQVGGREPLAVGFEMGPDARIKDGDVIPAGKFLVLVDEDTYDYGDSRRYGYIPEENLQYRLALNLADVWGKK